MRRHRCAYGEQQKPWIQLSFYTMEEQWKPKAEWAPECLWLSLFAWRYTSLQLKSLWKQDFVSRKLLVSFGNSCTAICPLSALSKKGKLDVQEDLGLLHKVLSIGTESASHTDVLRKAIRSSGLISQDKIGHDFVQICLVLGFFCVCLCVCFKLS